jgi:hypothetical protein
MNEPARKLSDLEFEEAIVTLQDGHVPFETPEMLRRFAETIICKLWETDEYSGESG